jgi:hypothetical protein
MIISRSAYSDMYLWKINTKPRRARISGLVHQLKARAAPVEING